MYGHGRNTDRTETTRTNYFKTERLYTASRINWFEELQIEIRTNNNRAQIRTVQSENVREQMHKKFKKLFEENTTIKDTKVKIQLKPG